MEPGFRRLEAGLGLAGGRPRTNTLMRPHSSFPPRVLDTPAALAPGTTRVFFCTAEAVFGRARARRAADGLDFVAIFAAGREAYVLWRPSGIDDALSLRRVAFDAYVEDALARDAALE